MAEEKKSYYAIIPANIRYDESLPPNAKLLYGEITALCNAEGYCWASNQYFADLYGVSHFTISRWINVLVSRGYITSQIVYKNGTKQIDKRYIQIRQYPIDENINTPIDEKVKDNNTSLNTTSNTSNKYKDDSPAKPPEEPKQKQFKPPTIEEVQAYCKERKNNVDAQRFFDFYNAADWYDSNGDKVRSWKQKVITWEGNRGKKQNTQQQGSGNMFIDMLRERGNGA